MSPRLFVLATLLALSGPALATEHFFATDTAAPGEWDPSLSYASNDVTVPVQNFFNLHQTEESETFGLSTGLTPAWSIGASIPYYSKDKLVAEPGSFQLHSRSEWHSATIGTSYRFEGDPKDGYSLLGTLGYRTNSAADGNDGLYGSLFAGWGARGEWRPYLGATLFFADHNYTRDSQHISFGLFKELSDAVILAPSLHVLHYSSDNATGTQTVWDAGLVAHLRLAPSIYLSPYLAYVEYGSVDSGGLHYESAHEVAWGASLSAFLGGS